MINLIVNPAAGSGAGRRTADVVSAELSRLGVVFDIHATAKAGDAPGIAEKLIREGRGTTAVVGGDGSVQELVGAFAYTGAPLGIIPAGSGNDLVASLYDRKTRDPLYFLGRILEGRTRRIDLIRCRAAEDREFVFVNIASVGLDAEIVHKADDFKKIFGRFAYIASTVYNAFVYKTTEMSCVADDFSYGGGLCLVSACNGRVYGGGFNIAPGARVDDGAITLCVVQPMNTLKILALFPSVLAGKHERLREINFIDTTRASVRYNGVKRINFDGNIFELNGPLEFEIMPGALTVFE